MSQWDDLRRRIQQAKASGAALRWSPVSPDELITLIEAAERAELIERKYRERLWLGHGHQGLYGDDGEMQCSLCHPFGDYKRDPIEKLEASVAAAKLAQLKAAIPNGDIDAYVRAALKGGQ
jgi:hypothetical protein